jgi:RNA polymerase sigma factor (sigma-70 family)
VQSVTAEAEFSAVYADTYWAVQRYFVRRLGGDAEHARDLTAEVFAVAWRRRSALPPEPLPWLYEVARRVLSNERRSERRRARLTEAVRRHEVVRQDDPVHAPSAPDRVHRALEHLSDSDQEVLRLAAWEELTTDQLAVALHCSRSAAAMRLHRARERFRARLELEDDLQQQARRRST